MNDIKITKAQHYKLEQLQTLDEVLQSMGSDFCQRFFKAMTATIDEELRRGKPRIH